MNKIDLYYKNTSLYAHLEINGQKISDFSDIHLLLQCPFHIMAGKLFEKLDNEILDDYSIVFSGYKLQYYILSDLSKKSKFCRKIDYSEPDFIYTESDIIFILSNIGEQNNIQFTEVDKLKIYSEIHIDNIDLSDYSDADILILNNSKSDKINNQKINMVFDESFGVVYSENGSYIYQIPESKFSEFLNYCVVYEKSIPIIVECLEKLKYIQLSDKDKTIIESIVNNKADFYINNVPENIDIGENITIDFESYPSDYYSLSSDSDNLSMSGNTVIGIHPGTANILVKDKSDKIFITKTVNIIKHNYATEIRLIPNFKEIKVNERKKIDIIILPQDAEDINLLQYNSSDPDIINFDSLGNVIALNPGVAVLSVSSKNIKSELRITVKPNLQKIYFDESIISIKTGQTKIIECKTVPENASTSNFIWEFDNNSIASINYTKDKKKCKISAATQKEGKGNIRCYDPETGCSAACPIEVYVHIKLTAIEKILFLISLISIFAAPVAFVPILADIAFIVKKYKPDRQKVYIANIAFSFIAFILSIIIFNM